MGKRKGQLNIVEIKKYWNEKWNNKNGNLMFSKYIIIIYKLLSVDKVEPETIAQTLYTSI